jgi:hypothetical protein
MVGALAVAGVGVVGNGGDRCRQGAAWLRWSAGMGLAVGGAWAAGHARTAWPVGAAGGARASGAAEAPENVGRKGAARAAGLLHELYGLQWLHGRPGLQAAEVAERKLTLQTTLAAVVARIGGSEYRALLAVQGSQGTELGCGDPAGGMLGTWVRGKGLGHAWHLG